MEEVLTPVELQRQILEAKQQLLVLQSQKEELLRTRKLWYFRPSPKQLKFFEQAGKKRRAGFCGNRFGKSTLGVVEDVCWLIGYRPFFPEGHPLRTQGIPRHGVKGLVIGEDLDKIKEIFTNDENKDRQGKFFDFLPEGWYKTKKNEKGVIIQITVFSEVDGAPRESVVYFDTVQAYKKNPASFESSDWDFIHIDEPVMRSLWTAVSRGLIDRGGFSWWLLTPIKEPWMYNEIVYNAKEQPDLYWWFEATMDDNPTLSGEDKELYLQQLPEAEREARRTGKPLAHALLVYSDYDEDVHLVDGPPTTWKNFKPPFETSCVAWAIDTHPQTPHAVLFIAINEDNSIDIYDELYEKGRIAEIGEAILNRLSGCRVIYGLCEPAAWNEDQGSGFRYADVFYDLGLDVIPGSKKKEVAVMLTQQMFRQRVREVRVHKKCKRLLMELKNNYFDKENKPEDKEDHMLECLRRLVIHDGLKYYTLAKTKAPLQYTTEKELQVPDYGLALGRGLSLTKF